MLLQGGEIFIMKGKKTGGSKTGNKSKVIDLSDRRNAYYFSKEFEFKVKSIIMAYRLITGDYDVDIADKFKLDELVKWYKANENSLEVIKLAAMFYHLFISVKPFIRNNQYMAQILMNTILSKQGYPPVVIPMERRIEFLGSMDESCIAIIEELIKRKSESKTMHQLEKIKGIDV